MKNDAKLGMLAGVLGVIVAAVMFANAPPPVAQSRPGAGPAPPAKETPAPQATLTAPAAPADASAPALPATPVVRTRKDVAAQPASRPGGADEEP
jgi:hypothetical protein